MITVFSDIHLSDETTSENVAKEAFHLLQDEIVNNAKHKKAKEVKIVLLGDIFDLMRTDYWLQIPEDQRPWNGILDPETGMNNNKEVIENHFNKLFNRILQTKSSKAFIKMLNSIQRKGNVTKKIPVEIIYVVGNHDRAFNNFESLRKMLNQKIKNAKLEFTDHYYDPDYAFLCRHGHEYDKENYGYELYKSLEGKEIELFDPCLNKVMSIGEVITCELMSGIIYRVGKKYGMKELAKLLMDVNNVRPLTNVFPWLTWYSRDLTDEKKHVILTSFKESLSQVMNSELGRKWDKISRGIMHLSQDIIDQFEIVWKFTKDKKFDEMAKYVEWGNRFNEMIDFIKSRILLKKEHYTESANNEWENKDEFKDLQYVFYGHTHEALYDYFSGQPDGKVRMYINTGTYLPYIQSTKDKTQNAKEKRGFASAYQMTMAFVCRRDEDKDKSLNNKNPTVDLWNGIKRKVYSN